MLLIIVFSVIANLALVSGECEHVTQKLKCFDSKKFSGLWYTILYNSNDIENNIACHEFFISSPVGNRSFMTSDLYVVSEQRHYKTYGYVTNWNSTGYMDIYYLVPMWNGQLQIVAVDYDRYVIAKFCYLELNKSSDYVAFRSLRPDEATKNEVLKELQENNIDASQLLERRADQCQQVESSTEGGSSS